MAAPSGHHHWQSILVASLQPLHRLRLLLSLTGWLSLKAEALVLDGAFCCFRREICASHLSLESALARTKITVIPSRTPIAAIYPASDEPLPDASSRLFKPISSTNPIPTSITIAVVLIAPLLSLGEGSMTAVWERGHDAELIAERRAKIEAFRHTRERSPRHFRGQRSD